MTDDKIYEIVLHGRGGQGAITAGLLLCEMAYKDGFKDVLSIPKIGAERRGAPIKAFVKLSRKRTIKNFAEPEDQDFTIIFDPSLIPLPGVADSVKHGTVLINTEKKSWPKIKVKNLYTVPVTKLAIENLGRPITNTAMLAAFAKITGLIKFESLVKAVKQRFEQKPKLVIKNIELMKKVFEKCSTA